MPEQFAFEERRSEGGAIASQERIVASTTELMDRPRDHFLAGTAFARDQDGCIRWRDAFDEGEHFAHRRTPTDHAFEIRAPDRLVAGEQTEAEGRVAAPASTSIRSWRAFTVERANPQP